MISFFKRIFSQPDAQSAPATTVPSSVQPPAPVSKTPSVASAGAPVIEGDCIQIPFSDIASRLTGPLAPRLSLTGAFPLPVKTALAQLPSGAVRIRFVQLRQAAAPGTFSNDASHDETLVDLPLQKILAAINPSMLTRRSGQVQVDVPDDVTGLFAGKEKSSARVVLPNPAPVAAAAPTPAPAPAPAPIQMPIISPIAPSAVAAAPVISSIAPAPIISPIAPSAPVPAPQISAGPTVTAKLSALYQTWPDAVRQEITQSNLTNASVALPMDRLESAMKTGRVAFTWGELTQWLDGSSAPSASSQGQTSVELPLKIIAPLFMAKRIAPTAQKKIVVSENIPNLFAGLNQGAATSAVAAPVAEVAPAAAPAPAPAVPNVLGEALGRPAKREWSPQEITQQINAMPGVMAAIMAMNDGFLVAGELPAPLKSDTMAAFLPQMFGRLATYSGEIQLGTLNTVTLTAGKSRCIIFKAGAVFLAVLGKPGEALPEAQLQRVATEMAERNQ